MVALLALLQTGTPALIFSQLMSESVGTWNPRSKPVHMTMIQDPRHSQQLGRGWNVHDGTSLIMVYAVMFYRLLLRCLAPPLYG
jgi:hypothetical protein